MYKDLLEKYRISDEEFKEEYVDEKESVGENKSGIQDGDEFVS